MQTTKRFLVLVTIGILFGALIPHSQAATFSGFSVTLSCNGFSTGTGTLTYDRDNTGTYDEAYFYRVVDGTGNLIARYPTDGTWNSPLAETEQYGGSALPYNLGTPTANPITFEWVSAAGNGLPEQVAFSASGTCDDLNEDEGEHSPAQPPAAEGEPLPASAVVARFVTDTPLYFAPSEGSTTEAIMRIDQTAWTLGIDESGEFYKVLFANQTYWVPVASLGTSSDALFAGLALPTNVVE